MQPHRQFQITEYTECEQCHVEFVMNYEDAYICDDCTDSAIIEPTMDSSLS